MNKPDLIAKTATLLNVKPKQVEVTLDLLESGHTVPFIARYRKDLTENLDEDQIKQISDSYEYQLNLQKRKEAILQILEQRELLTPELEELIKNCEKLSELENIYKPYKENKKTKASEAIKLGLKPLADWMLKLYKTPTLSEYAINYVNDNVKTVEEAIKQAQYIIAEIVTNDKEIRDCLKETIKNYGAIVTKLKKDAQDENETFKIYYDFRIKISFLSAYKIMAIDRGENKKILSVSLDYKNEYALKKAYFKYSKNFESETAIKVKEAIDDAFKRLLEPSIENEVRNDLTEFAHEESSLRFAHNLEQLLLQNPIKDKNILGWDPAYRTGCKLAIVSSNNEMKLVDVVFPFFNEKQIQEAKTKLLDYIKLFKIDIIAIGNGTASRESEEFVANFIKENNLNIQYCIVSEAGASVYSASEIAQKEFPDLTVEKRSAISIARRIIDPLSELIKIPALSIGVGQYQHDIKLNELNNKLDFVIEKVVNSVGVNLNTASEILLSKISGLNKTIAKNIVEYRNKNEFIKTRQELFDIKGITNKNFEQAAGFLRILGTEPLDKTDIHPESYELAYKLIDELKINVNTLGTEETIKIVNKANQEELAEKFNTPVQTIKQIIDCFKNKLMDYREQYPQPKLKKEILNIENLYNGLILDAVVRNILDFGAFVDIGIKESALLHISQMSSDKSKTPYDILDINDIIKVEIINIDIANKKIQVKLLN